MTPNDPQGSAGPDPTPPTPVVPPVAGQNPLAAGERTRILRVLDANANRASEGLRVAEEYVRFVLDESTLTRRCKQLRHDLHSSLAPWQAALVRCRDTRRDVGTAIGTEQEYCRSDAGQLAGANLKRAEQAIRCLEEYFKLLDPPLAKSLESLRYECYDLSQVIMSRRYGAGRLDSAQLYLLLDGGASREAFSELLRSVVPFVDVVQLREKRLEDGELLARARLARDITGRAGVLLVVNDRPDLAVLCGADGVHLGQEDLSPADARRIVGPDLLIGVSTHNPGQLQAALAAGADYLGCGPTFPSQTKPFAAFAGLEFLRMASGQTPVPAFAIGGIQLQNLDQVLETGFWRVAVAGAVVGAEDPAQAARLLQARLRAARKPGENA